MGKDLEPVADNTRIVLFEKHQFFYYRTYGGKIGHRCLDLCMVSTKNSNIIPNVRGEVHIGSNACHECIYNKGFNIQKGYIICSNLVNATLNTIST